MSELLIECSNTSRHYGGKQVLNNINWRISQGEIWGLLGANGAGKSTLLRAILGLNKSHGDVLFAEALGKSERGAIAAVSDLSTLPKWMSLKQIVEFMSGVNPRFDATKAWDNLSRTELSAKQKPSQMSKGQLVQAHLALIMATDAKVLILDEPTLGLDQVFRDKFYRHLMEWYQDGERTVIIASHELMEIEPMLSHVMMLDHGDQVLNHSMPALYEEFQWVDNIEVSDTVLTKKKMLKEEYALVHQPSAGSGESASLLDVFLGLQKENAHV